jgi:hypothetical protein
VATPDDSPAASIAPRDNSASASKGDEPAAEAPAAGAPAADTPGTGDDTATDDGDTEPAPTTAAPIVRTGGTLAVGALTATSSGPRTDVSGTATLTVGSQIVSGALSGRLSLGAADADGRQRLDGTLTLTTDDGRIEIRLTGYATLDADDESVSALSGLFRTSGSDTLLTSGSMRGSLGDALSLTLSA